MRGINEKDVYYTYWRIYIIPTSIMLAQNMQLRHIETTLQRKVEITSDIIMQECSKHVDAAMMYRILCIHDIPIWRIKSAEVEKASNLWAHT